jgi:excinuclease UvrABC ATPase subunit
LKPERLTRLKEDIIKLLSENDKFLILTFEDGKINYEYYTDKNFCPNCDIKYPQFTPQHFSPNRQE